jgi:hypothetical protein
MVFLLTLAFAGCRAEGESIGAARASGGAGAAGAASGGGTSTGSGGTSGGHGGSAAVTLAVGATLANELFAWQGQFADRDSRTGHAVTGGGAFR